MTTMITSLIDELNLVLVESPTGKIHVESWFSETLCGKYINYGYRGWSWRMKASVRYLAQNAQSPNPYGKMCKSCLNNYKDVNIDG